MSVSAVDSACQIILYNIGLSPSRDRTCLLVGAGAGGVVQYTVRLSGWVFRGRDLRVVEILRKHLHNSCHSDLDSWRCLRYLSSTDGNVKYVEHGARSGVIAEQTTPIGSSPGCTLDMVQYREMQPKSQPRRQAGQKRQDLKFTRGMSPRTYRKSRNATNIASTTQYLKTDQPPTTVMHHSTARKTRVPPYRAPRRITSSQSPTKYLPER
ncbi:hypothetical protein VTK56DRAFT_6945 [Thermocarpiscus australiensis]